MNLKIYGNTESDNPTAVIPNMFFDFNGQQFEFDTRNRNILYDINATTGGNINDFNHEVKSKIKMLLHLYHDFENLTDFFLNEKKLKDMLHDNFYFLTVQESPLHGEFSNLLYNDFWFNMVKGYYTDFQFKKDTIKWYYHNRDSYVLREIPTAEHKTKIYVAPNRVRLTKSRRTKFRFMLVNKLSKFKNLGYIGAITLNKSWILHPHGDFPDCNNINELIQFKNKREEKWGFAPIHWEYLNDTFISVYAETIEFGNEYFVSEKTYDPLIRGHFILPFSNRGFIKKLKLLGFKFPNFINYDYDEITDDDSRFEKYNEELTRLMSLKLEDWQNHWNNNIEILQDNRNLMLSKPYDRLDLYNLLTNV